MEFKELNILLPISDDASLLKFIESAFEYRLDHKETSGQLSTFVFNNIFPYVKKINNDSLNFVNNFAHIDYIHRDEDLTDEEYEKIVDDVWQKQYKLFVEEKEKRAR